MIEHTMAWGGSTRPGTIPLPRGGGPLILGDHTIAWGGPLTLEPPIIYIYIDIAAEQNYTQLTKNKRR